MPVFLEENVRKETRSAWTYRHRRTATIDSAYLEESFYNEILRVLEKHSGKCLDTPTERAKVAQAVARRLADSALADDGEFAALVHKK